MTRAISGCCGSTSHLARPKRFAGWSFASGGSCLSGAAISNGDLFWGSGYSNFGFGTPNNKLYAFTVR